MQPGASHRSRVWRIPAKETCSLPWQLQMPVSECPLFPCSRSGFPSMAAQLDYSFSYEPPGKGGKYKNYYYFFFSHSQRLVTNTSVSLTPGNSSSSSLAPRQSRWHCRGICWQPAVSYLESSSMFLLPAAPSARTRENPDEKSWISGLCCKKCIWESQINVMQGTWFLHFLNFKCVTLHSINIHRVFSSFTFCYCYGKLCKYYEQSPKNPQVIGKYINLFQISLYLSPLVLEASNFKEGLQIVSAC